MRWQVLPSKVGNKIERHLVSSEGRSLCGKTMPVWRAATEIALETKASQCESCLVKKRAIDSPPSEGES